MNSMRGQQKILALVLGVIVVAGLVWWGSRNRQEAKNASAIKIGVVMPLAAGTGSFYGQYGQRGLELAQEKINSTGGINGRELQLIYENSEGKPKVGVEAANKLINEEGVHVIIGDQISGVTLAIASLVEQNRVLYIAPGSASPKVSQAGDYIFRTKVSADIESKAAAQFIVRDLKARRIAFLYQNSDYGKGVFDALKVDLQKENAQVVAEELFDIGAADMRTQLIKIKNSQADYILVAAYPQETGIILRQAKQLGLSQKFFAHSGSVGPDTWQQAEEAAEGVLYLYEIKLDSSQPETGDFIQRYQAAYGSEPELFSALAYDTLLLLSEKLRVCSDDVNCLKTALYQTNNFSGVTGMLSFDHNGDIIRNTFTPMIIRAGRPVLFNTTRE